jgi:hypothetical protein
MAVFLIMAENLILNLDFFFTGLYELFLSSRLQPFEILNIVPLISSQYYLIVNGSVSGRHLVYICANLGFLVLLFYLI